MMIELFSNPRNGLVLVLLACSVSFATALTSLHAQEAQMPPSSPKSNGERFFSFADEESMEKYVGEFNHRIKIRAGAGFGRLNPAILNETAPSWMLNSFLRTEQDRGLPLAIPISKVLILATEPVYQEISYGWSNRVDLSYSRDRNLGTFDQGSSASVLFFSPRTDRYWGSAFEGNRLLRFEGVSENVRLSYTHPILDWLMVGPSVNYHRYTEKNEISNGSYTATRPTNDLANPGNQVTWSSGGSASAEYVMRGILPGIYAKLQLTPWWEIRSRVELIRRKGNLATLGTQLIQITPQNGDVRYDLVVPAYWGQAEDRGTQVMVESSFRYCRFTLDIGVIRQDVTRKYSGYYGDTYGGGVNRSDYSARTSALGIGEMISKFRHTTTEIYLMPGVSFHFDEDGVY